MTRYVITPDAALRVVQEQIAIDDQHELLAPTLMRSQVLSLLYQATRRGELNKKDANDCLAHLRRLRIRFLGDRVLQNVAWKIATELESPDTFDAEYVALTQLQADALVTGDAGLVSAASNYVPVAPVEALS